MVKSDQTPVGSVIDGRYRVEALVARGGMATVYRATDLRLERVVALKIMHGALAEDDDFVARFVREARSAAQLNHPAIVSVFDQGEADGHVYLAMEYVDGETLRARLTREGRLSPQSALEICEPLLEALSAAHAAGFAHRDIKPENVLIGTDGRVKVADFGLARAIVSSDTSGLTRGLLIGTVAYLAPEQVESGQADARTDVYAAGIVLYEMVVGQTPFAGETPMSVAYQHVHSQVPVPSTIRRDIPNDVDQLVAIATAHAPADRYTDASDFAAHLRAVRVGLEDVAIPFAEGHQTVVLDRSNQTIASSHATTEPGATSTRAIAADSGTVLATTTTPPGHVGPPDGPWIVTQDGTSSGGEPPTTGNTPPTYTPRQPHRYRVLIAALVLALLASVAGYGAWAWTQARLVSMPNIVGMTPAAASAELAKDDVSLRIIGKDFSSTVPKGRILLTDPGAGEQLSIGGEVIARTSAGPQLVKVPRLAGKSEESALAALRKAQLKGSSTLEYSDSVDEGIVIRSSPQSGKSTPIGSTVDFVISKGPPPVTVPDVVRMDKDSAVAALTAAGLTVNVANQLPVVVVGRVYSQDPAPGSVVAKGTTVTITIV